MQVKPAFDLTGQLFGRLTAIKVVKKDKARRYYWLCRCRCSRTTTVRADYLRDAVIESCGCLRVDKRRSGMSLRQALARLAPRPV